MKISRIILKGVNNFEDFDCSFEDEWSKSVPASLLLMGPNGSGKTTILRAIETLWINFGQFLEGQQNLHYLAEDSIFKKCRLAAMEIRDFSSETPEPVWVYFGELAEVKSILQNHQGSHRISGTLSNISTFA